jgi:hypothetical protein
MDFAQYYPNESDSESHYTSGSLTNQFVSIDAIRVRLSSIVA